ncbi:MAG: hypothetical protein KAG53_01560 [Endozoicomonadaceae bacterium]|nr:hypothetical protein [Endozoicomonadaceae bacterium]
MNINNSESEYCHPSIDITSKSDEASAASSKDKFYHRPMPSQESSTSQPPIELNQRIIQLLQLKYNDLNLDEIIKVNGDIKEIVSNVQSYLDSNELTSGFPAREMYRLFIDKTNWDPELGFFIYENESGYSKALLNTFIKLKQILSNGEFNFKKLSRIHELSVKGVANDTLCHLDISEVFCVPLILGYNCTRKGFMEISELIKNKKHSWIANRYPVYIGNCCIERGLINPLIPDHKPNCTISDAVAGINHRIPENRIYVSEYFYAYNKKIKNIKANHKHTQEERQHLIITAIAEVCRNIQMSHPFPDGNARSICMSFNGLLMIEKMSPSIIPDTNIFDSHSIKELVKIMLDGQQLFQALRVPRCTT